MPVKLKIEFAVIALITLIGIVQYAVGLIQQH